MAEDVQRSTGTSKRYKLDAGGAPVDPGPHIGIVKNNSDVTRTGKLLVYIDFLSGPNQEDPSGWQSVSYISPFYGTTNAVPGPPESGTGNFTQNKHSYGMWFTPPDVGTEVICFFVRGDRNQGYYLGSKVNPDAHHMVPAIGSTENFVNSGSPYFADSPQLPTIELNDNSRELADSERFFDSEKPIHQVQAYVLLQQGLINDTVRGTIGSNSYRESPSSVFGLSTPGRPIYQGGLRNENILARLNDDANNPGSVPFEAMQIVGREGGHSIVLDDGDIAGNDQLVRLRTAKGHQILLSDSGDSVYILHANGQSWIELGAEGTIDMYSANSVNIRSGDINLHADRSLNINASTVNLNAESKMNLQSKNLQITGDDSFLMYSEKYIGVKSDGLLSLDSDKQGTWDAGSRLTLYAGCIDLNGGKAPSVTKTTPIARQKLPDTKWQQNIGWIVEQSKIDTVVTRAPTHEPYPYHNNGVNKITDYAGTTDNVPLPSDIDNKLTAIQDTEFTGITAGQYETQLPVDATIGNIQPEQLTGMLAQSSADVAQSFNTISEELGVGKFGLSADQLEKVGYLKPGTVDFFLKDGSANLTTVLQSTSVWSGLNGVENITGVLGDERIQDFIKTDLYSSALNDLRAEGLVTGFESPEKLASLVEPASKYGVSTVKSWINDNAGLGQEVTTQMNKLARGAQFSVEVANQKLNESIKGYSSSSGSSTNTVTRTNIDSQAKTVITTNKTQGPSYTRTVSGTTDPNFQARRNTILAQIQEIDNQTQQERTRYFNQNPNASPGDWLKSTEFKALKNRKQSLQAQLNNL